MAELPTGTVTFLLTDVEGSTALWEREPAAMRAATARHDALIEAAVAEHGGVVVRPRGEGDSRFAVFARASDAVAAALALQWDLTAEPWPTSVPLRVRVALHTGEADLRDGDYYGAAVNRCARLRAIAHGGQVLLSRATSDLAQGMLAEGVGLRDLGRHQLRDLLAPEQVFQLLHPSLPDAFPVLPSLDAVPNNLPLQLTSFVGRERELAEVGRLLVTTRLLTLTGTGGCGKTRLALHLAAEVIDAYPDGVWLVELAALTDPDLAPRAVAHVLGVTEHASEPLVTTLVRVLRSRRLLVVLDNCEHLLDACARLAEALLQGCPQLTILATSREALGSAGEVPWRIPSLSLPDPRRTPLVAEVAVAEAVRLFVERARVVQPAFGVTEGNAAAVVQVCRRLDGIPLALELAAARLNVLTVEQIATRLDDRFRLLTGGRRTALRRQQTLAATIDWSYALLTEAERGLLHRLSVFAGGWTLTAAEAVGAGDGIEMWEILDLLTQLVEKSLVVTEPELAGETRYRLLETVRQYAGEKLLASGEADGVRDRHLAWHLSLAEQAELALRSGEHLMWLARLDVEHDNLRAALAWSLDDAPQDGLRLANGIWRFWRLRGHLTEAIRWLQDLLARGPEPTVARGRALLALGVLLRGQGEGATARVLLEESLAVCRAVGDRFGEINALRDLGGAVAMLGDLAQAQALEEEALAMARADEDAFQVGVTLHMLGAVLTAQGQYDLARPVLVESVAVTRTVGEASMMAVALLRFGELAWSLGERANAVAALRESLTHFQSVAEQSFIGETMCALGLATLLAGDLAQARSLLEESIAVARAVGRVPTVCRALCGLGQVAWAEGEPHRAATAFRESLTLARQTGDPAMVVVNLEGLAAVAAGLARPQRAARLLGSEAALRQARGIARPPVEQAGYEELVHRVEAALGGRAFTAAWAAGEALTLEDAVGEALAGDPVG